MLSNVEINDLLEAISSRDCEKSYKVLFVSLHENLYRFAFGILKSTEDAEEVVSDLFINLWVKRKNLKRLDNPKLYLLIGTKNFALNRLKLNKRKVSLQIDDFSTHLESVFFNPEELAISSELTQRIMESVNGLPPKCKIIFKLIKEEGLKYQEVAELLDLSVKTVESQMAIALRRIRQCLEFKHEFPEIHSILAKK